MRVCARIREEEGGGIGEGLCIGSPCLIHDMTTLVHGFMCSRIHGLIIYFTSSIIFAFTPL